MTDMKNFIYNGMNVRTAVVNGESWFVAADICRILDIGNPSDALSRLDDDEKNTLVLTEGIPGNPEKRVVNEAGLYTLILRSRKPEARAFRRWVTHEVLPAIRKTGIYATEAILDNPDLAIAALTKLKEERNRARELAQINAAQQQQLAELRPKATYFDLVLQCRDLVSTSTIAKDYGWSANRMKGTVEFRLFNGTLHAGEIKAYIQFCLAVAHQALTQKKASAKKTETDNEKYAFRCWMLRLGLIGDEFKTCRQHMLKHLSGNSAWRNAA